MTTKPTTAECIAKIDEALKYYECDDTWFKLYTAFRAQLLAAQEMANGVPAASSQMIKAERFIAQGHGFECPELVDAQIRLDKSLTAWRKAGGQ